MTASCVPVLIQQNIHGSNFFNRSWAAFKVGFNDTFGNFWLGNDLLSQLTLSRSYKLRFALQARNHSWFYAEYSSFLVYEESRNYEIFLGGYSGNTGDGFIYSNNMMFTTYDRDNDPWTDSDYNDNCAVRNGGGFWYKTCAHSNVNAIRDRGEDFRWYSPEKRHLWLQTSRMWLMC